MILINVSQERCELNNLRGVPNYILKLVNNVPYSHVPYSPINKEKKILIFWKPIEVVDKSLYGALSH